MPRASAKRKKAPARKKKGGGGFFWPALILALAGVCAWLVWRNRESSSASERARLFSERVPATRANPAPEPQPEAPAVSPETLPSPTPVTISTSIVTPIVTAPAPATNSVVEAVAPTNKPPRVDFAPRPPKTLLEAQIALARLGISSGSLDGVSGSQTRQALRVFQESRGLLVSGELDAETREALRVDAPPEGTYLVTADDLSRISPVPKTWLDKSREKSLNYESVLEMVAERSRAHPSLIRSLNPKVNWTNVLAGTVVKTPRAEYPPIRRKAAFIRIRMSYNTLQAFDSNTNLLVHFPCSIAQRVEKRPVGELQVERVALGPNYRFDPATFPESAEGRILGRPLMIPPGPNNPVGTAWIGLSREGYGIHGTPRPEEVGRTESHGCFRLANWNAEYLAQLVSRGTTVLVEH